MKGNYMIDRCDDCGIRCKIWTNRAGKLICRKCSTNVL